MAVVATAYLVCHARSVCRDGKKIDLEAVSWQSADAPFETLRTNGLRE